MNKGGCILLSKDLKKVAIVYREKQNDYSFPKGHIEKEENIVNCAIRETEEETGRVCNLLSRTPIGIFNYNNYEGTIKTYMYLAVDNGPINRRIKDEDKEITIWVPFDEVEEKLTYQDLKDFWNNVKDKIKILTK